MSVEENTVESEKPALTYRQRKIKEDPEGYYLKRREEVNKYRKKLREKDPEGYRDKVKKYMLSRKEKMRVEYPDRYRKNFVDYRKIKIEENSDEFRAKEASSQKVYSKTDKGLATKIVRSAKSRANSKKLPFDLDVDFIVEKLVSGVCEVTGIPFSRSKDEKYSRGPYIPSLDRVIPSKGYVKTNVRMVLWAVNVAASDWGLENFLPIAALLKNEELQAHKET